MNNLLFFSKSKYCEEYVKNALNPQFKGHSRNTTRNLIHKQFNEDKLKLIQTLGNLKCKVALTFDVWTDLTNFLYLCVTCHYVDSDWILQKRIITFQIFEHLHSSFAIYDVLIAI